MISVRERRGLSVYPVVKILGEGGGGVKQKQFVRIGVNFLKRIERVV